MFKSGDIALITEPKDWDTGPAFVKGMAKFCGHKVVIESVEDCDNEHDCDGGESYYFAGDWMKKVNKFKGNK